MKKSLFVKALALLMAALLLTACGSNAASTATTEAATEAPATESEATEAQTEAETVAQAVEEAVSQYAASNGKVKMALVAGNNGGTFWGPIQENFEKRCSELGWECSYMAPSGTEGGTADILSLCDTALVQGYNVIAAVMTDNDVFEDFRNRAAEQNVLVLGFNCDPGEDIVPAEVGIDSYESGYQQGEKIAEYANSYGWDEIRYFSACTSLSMTTQQRTKEGVLDAIAANFSGTVTELGETESQGSAATAQDQIGATYIAHPDVNTIFCLEAYSAVGAAAFIEENDLQGKIICCGLALDKDAFLRVQNGSWTATSSVDVEWMGTQIVDVANTILTGGEYVYKNFPDKIWVCTQEEIDAYCEEHGIDMN